MKANLKKMGIPLKEIRYALATHYHIDHAGLGEELKSEGVPLLVIEHQVKAIPLMKTWTKPVDKYIEITMAGNLVIPFTGDLPPEGSSFDNPTALAIWQFLRQRGARQVYPGHRRIRPIDPPLD